MSFNSTWEIGVLMAGCRDELNKLEPNDWKNKETIEDLYAQAIELTVKDNCGLIMPIDECIDWVICGSIIDYDGHGYLLDKDGERIGSMHCDASFLVEAKENGACFVAWYNK